MISLNAIVVSPCCLTIILFLYEPGDPPDLLDGLGLDCRHDRLGALEGSDGTNALAGVAANLGQVRGLGGSTEVTEDLVYAR